MFKACIFDLDGTLADTIESIWYSSNEALAAVGLPPQPMDDYKYYAGDGAKVLIERALTAAGDINLAHFDRAYAVYGDFFKKDCTYKVTVFDGMKETLDALKARGLKLAVLSNKPHARSIDVVNKLFGEGYFDMVRGQVDGVPRKPAPDGAVKIAEAFGVRPDECLYVGDTNTDMQTGRGAGMYTVGVLWGFRPRKELEENRAMEIISRPSQLLEIAARKVRLIVTDVDGTLIENGVPELDEKYNRCIKTLLKNGVAVAAASGRQIESLTHIFKENAADMYLIGENGGQVAYNGADVEFKSIDSEMLVQLILDIRKIGHCETLLSCADTHYVEEKDVDLYHHLTEVVHHKVAVIDDLTKVDKPVCKVSIYREGGIEDVVDYFMKKWSDQLHVAVSAAEWLDFNRPDVNKGEAVREIQKKLGISREETMAFGDSDNDLEMLDRAVLSYAKTEARASVRVKSAFLTDDVYTQLAALTGEVEK